MTTPSRKASKWELDLLDARVVAVEAGGGGVSELSDLTDVNTSTPTNRNVLVADGVDWESRALVEADISDLQAYAQQLSDLSDVNSSGVTNRNVLVADGVDFESRALVSADISDLGTFIADGTSTNNTLYWSGSAWLETSNLTVVPAGAVTLGHNGSDKLNTAAGGIEMISATNLTSDTTGTPVINLTLWDSDKTHLIGFLGFGSSPANAFEIVNRRHSGHLNLVGQNSAGTDITMFSGDPDLGSTLYYTNAAVARSIAAASGGLEANNTSTGAGWERVLTTSDSAGGATSLTSLTDVTLTAPVTGGILYKSAGDWIDTDAIEVDPIGSITLKYNTEDRISTTVNGEARMIGDVDITSDTTGSPRSTVTFYDSDQSHLLGFFGYGTSTPNIFEIVNRRHGGNLNFLGQNAAGTDITMIECDPDADTSLWYANSKVAETTSQGMDVLTSSGAAILDVINTVLDSDAVLGLRGNGGGVRLKWDDSADAGYIVQTTASGTEEDFWAKFSLNGGFHTYFNNVAETSTVQHDANYATSGLVVKDHGGTTRDVGFNLMAPVTQTTSVTLDETHVSKYITKNAGTAHTITLPPGTSGAIPPVGATIVLSNTDADSITITASGFGVLHFFEGTGVPATGNRTLAQGGVCTIYHMSDTVWHIWGNAGLT